MCAAIGLTVGLGALGAAANVAAQTPPAGPPAETSPAALKRIAGRYLAWRGGPAFEGLRTIHYVGAIRVPGQGLTFTTDVWTDRGDRIWTRVSTPNDQVVRAVTPTDAWTASGVDLIRFEGQDAAEAALIRDQTRLQFADALLGMGPAKTALAGAERLDGRDWSVVRLTFPDGAVFDAFVDSASGALWGYRHRGPDKTLWVRYGDWRFVGGVRMPFLIGDNAGGPPMRIKSLELGPALPSALFDRDAVKAELARLSPTYGGTERFADGASSTGWIPFDFRDGQILFPVKVEGHDALAQLDNDNGATSVSPALARRAGLRLGGAVTIAGVNGAASGRLAPARLRIGNLQLDAPQAKTAMPSLNPDVTSPDVILGADLFSGVVVDIDFANHRLAFRDPAQFAPPVGAAAMPISWSRGGPAAPGSLEGASALFAIDLGFTGALSLELSNAAARVVDGRNTTLTPVGGYGGGGLERIATLRSLTFAGTTFEDVPTLLDDARLIDVYGDAVAGALGTQVLGRFHVIFDYPAGRLYLVPRPGDRTTRFGRDRLGMQVVVDGASRKVWYVAPGGPAAAAGLKAGDCIVAVNGHGLEGWDADTNPADGVKLAFTLQGGAVKTLTVGAFY